MWVEFLVGSLLAPIGFLRVLRFPPLHKNQHCQIPIRSGVHGHMLKRAVVALLSVQWMNETIIIIIIIIIITIIII